MRVSAQPRLHSPIAYALKHPYIHLHTHPQNLGDEGTAYVVEALAFNTTCRALDLSKNGIGGGLGAAALVQVSASGGKGGEERGGLRWAAERSSTDWRSRGG